MLTATVSGLKKPSTADDFEQIFKEHSGLIYRTAYGVTGSPEDAEDVLQTIFLRLLVRDLPPDLKQKPKAYLYRAAVNLSLDILRARKRQARAGAVLAAEPTPPANDSDFEEELHRLLYEAIAELQPESAQIVILRHIHNYSDAEIAKLLGASRAAVAVRLFRSRTRLKKLIIAKTGAKS
jgi:RNA polymerase sigma factor (sigma-70 family)